MKSAQWRAVVILLAALAPFVPMLMRGEVPAFRDHLDYFVPLREVTARALGAAELPLWNSRNASGEAWLANPQTGVFYPPAWIMAVLPFRVGYCLFLSVHLAIAGLGWRRLMLRWTRDDVATLSACGLLLSGPILSTLDVSNSLASLAWVPLALSFAFEGRKGAIFRDAAVIALMFLGGEPLIAFGGAVLYASIRLARERRAALGSVAGVGAMSALFCAMQLLPFLESLRGSDRSYGLAPAAALAQSMAPIDWLRLPLTPLAPGAAEMTVASQRFLLSILVSPMLILPAFALLLLWRAAHFPRRAVAGWIALLLASVFLAAGSSLALSERVYLAVGLAVSRYPVKFAHFGILALVALGAICLEALLGEQRAVARRGALAVAFGAALSILVAPSASLEARLLLATWALAIIGVLVWQPPREVVLSIAILFVSAESITASRFLLESKPLPTTAAPRDAVLRSERKVARLEQLDRRHDAVAGRASREAWLGGYLNLRDGQFDAMTAAPVVDARYLALLDYALSRPRIDILDFLGAGYLLTTRRIDVGGYREIAAREGVKIYERDAAFPVVTIWENVSLESDSTKAFNALFSESWLATEMITVTGGTPSRPQDAASGPVGRSRVVELTWHTISAEVDSPRGGVAVVSQRDAPGWRVKVDGVRAQPLLVDGLFRGVAVPAGTHTVEWSYLPLSCVAGTLLSVMGITGAIFVLFRRRRTRFA